MTHPAHLPSGEETLMLLAAGLVRQHRACSKGDVLDARDDARRTLTPLALLKAQARIARLQIAAGELATADSLHRLVVDCTRPLGDWAPAALLGQDGEWREVQLVDPDTRTPTLDCLGIAGEGDNVDDLREQVWFKKVHEELALVPVAALRDEAYRVLRRFVVTHALASRGELDEVVARLDEVAPGSSLGPLLAQMYVPAREGEHDEVVERCANCGGYVERADRRARREARCASGRCRERLPILVVRDALPRAEALLLLRELVLYWAEPGYEEVRLFDALRAVREDVTLYPRQDEVDLSVGEGRDVGVDLKDYAFMPQLARRFERGLGDLALYRRPVIVVTDRGSPAFGEARARQLQELLRERDLTVEVMTVRMAFEIFGRPSGGTR